MIHRDLKLPNILIHLPNRDSGKPIPWEEVDLEKEQFIVKIADFGFARYLDDTETAESGCGTPLMMAPEVL